LKASSQVLRFGGAKYISPSVATGLKAVAERPLFSWIDSHVVLNHTNWTTVLILHEKATAEGLPDKTVAASAATATTNMAARLRIQRAEKLECKYWAITRC